MDKVSIRSTSRQSAVCSDVVLRESEQVRLIFRPEMVENPHNPAACIKGRFIYQKKGKKDVWQDFDLIPLSSIKKGEGFELEVKSGELLPLLQQLGALYRVHRRQGIPEGRVEFVRIEEQLAKLLQLSEPELNEFLSANTPGAVQTLRRVLRWLSKEPSRIEQLAVDDAQLGNLNALVGLANLCAVLKIWRDNSGNEDEEFWQRAFGKHAFVLSQLFAYPVVVIKDKAYVGGKRLDNAHGNLVDFLAKVSSSGAAVLIEIKTPGTRLLGPEYRQDVYPPSRDLGGAIAQVLHYRESLLQQLHLLTGPEDRLLPSEPKCLVIAGCAERELISENQRRSFERFRDRVQGVTVVTFDEVFARVQALVELLQRADT